MSYIRAGRACDPPGEPTAEVLGVSDSNKSVSLTVTGPSGDLFPPVVDIPWEPGMNAQQQLEVGFDQTERFHFFLEYFGHSSTGYLGYMVTQFSDVEEHDPYYWMLFVNGSLSAVGVDTHELSEGDSVHWRYQQWSDGEHGDIEILRAKRDRVLIRANAR
jgi:Domain of unknown function (DUF4430)